MGRWLGSAQNKVCKWDVFKVVIQTQIQDSAQTNTNMSLKCLQFNLKKIWGYVSTPTNLEELFNSPPNKMKVSSKHAKSTPNRARARLNPAHQRPLSRNPPNADAVCPTDPSGPTPHHPTPHRASHSALLSRNQSIEAVCDNVTTLIIVARFWARTTGIAHWDRAGRWRLGRAVGDLTRMLFPLPNQ
jgi:hypothetical protein